MDSHPAMTIGELAQQAGKSARAIRLYEELGLIQPDARTDGNYRLFGPEALVRLRWIGQLGELGLPLHEVQDLLAGLAAATSGEEAMDLVRARYRATLTRLEDQIRRLEELRGGLLDSLQYLEACRGCPETGLPTCCRVCPRHGASPPELVAGLYAQAPRRTLERNDEPIS